MSITYAVLATSFAGLGATRRMLASTTKKQGNLMNCQHDYDNPIRNGRANYSCPKCGKDISLILVLMQDAEEEIIKEQNDYRKNRVSGRREVARESTCK